MLCSRCNKEIICNPIIQFEYDNERSYFHSDCMVREERRDRKKLRKLGKVFVNPNQGG